METKQINTTNSNNSTNNTSNANTNTGNEDRQVLKFHTMKEDIDKYRLHYNNFTFTPTSYMKDLNLEGSNNFNMNNNAYNKYNLFKENVSPRTGNTNSTTNITVYDQLKMNRGHSTNFKE
jgi:hypothetical protein